MREALGRERRERPLAALRWLQRLLQLVETLGRNRRRGFVVPELRRAGIAQLPYDGYRVIYRIEPTRVVILTLRSSAKHVHDRERDRHHHGE